MTLPAIGIIGMGFLGQEVAQLADWPAQSWGTNLQALETSDLKPTSLKQFSFNWQDTSHWEKLPLGSGTLILTVPPIQPKVKEEKNRLKAWGGWMNINRPDYHSLIYISSTGVYPNDKGIWEENADFKPDNLKGRLRLATEEVLGDFFEVRVIRPGAIYGNKRNIIERMKAGKPIPSGDHPVHRIHVKDLAQIVLLALTQKDFPSPINAVDMDPAPSRNVAEWALKQGLAAALSGTQLKFKNGFDTRKNLPPINQRWVSNHLLTETCGYQFLYPTYKEGLLDKLS